MKKLCHSLTELQSSFRFLSGRIEKWPVLIEMFEGYSERSDRQNSTIHMHFAEAAAYFGWTERYAKNFAKYTYGLPILANRRNKNGDLTEDARYWLSLSDRIDLWPYAARIESMTEIPVTSKMTPKECVVFINTYMREWSQQGCHLTDPSEIDTDHFVELDQELRSRGVL